MRWFVATFAFLLLAAVPGRCDEASEPIPEISIRGANPEYRSLSESELGQVHSIPQQTIRASNPTSVDTLLKQVPGYSLFRRSESSVAHPTTQGVSLRGTGPSGASRTVVMLDGIPMNDAFGGWVNWQSIPVEGLERVKVQENWGSTHWSYLGLNSTIELQTKEPLKRSVEGKFQAGSQQTNLEHLYLAERKGNFAGSIAGEHFRTGGYRTISPEDRGEIDVEASSRHATGYGKLNYEGESTTGYLLWNGFDEERSNGTPLTGNTTRSANLSGESRMALAGGGLLRANLFASVNRFESQFSAQSPDRTTESPASDQFDVPAEQIGVSSDWSTRWARSHYLEIGADVLGRQSESNERFRFLDGDFKRERSAGAEQAMIGGYVFDRHRMGASVTLDTFLRVDGWVTPEQFRRERDIGADDFDRNESFDSSKKVFVSPRIQLTYELDRHSSVRTALTRGLRIPTINELVRPFRVRNDVTEVNPNLAHEEIVGYDIEYAYRAGRFEGRLAGFANRIHNSIANVTLEGDAASICGFLPPGGSCSQRNNLDEVLVGGAELSARYQLTDTLAVSSSYLLTASSILDAGEWSALRAKHLEQLPRHQAQLRVENDFGKVRLWTQMRYSGSQFDDDLNTSLLQPFITADVSITVPIDRYGELFVSGTNLFGARVDVGRTNEGVTTTGAPLAMILGARVRY